METSEKTTEKPPVLKKFVFKNWKSFEEGTLYFDPLTVLIGRNASGKTNAIEALNFFISCVSGEDIYAVARKVRGNFKNLFFSPEKSLFFEATVEKDEKTDCIYSVEIGFSVINNVIDAAIEKLSIATEEENWEPRTLIKSWTRDYRKKVDEEKEIFKLLEPRKMVKFIDYDNSRLDFRIPTYSQAFQLNFKSEIGFYIKNSFGILTGRKDNETIIDKLSDIQQQSELVFDAINDALLKLNVYAPVPANMRDYSPLSNMLSSNCGNIAGYLSFLSDSKRSRPSYLPSFEELMKKINSYLVALPEKEFKEIKAERVGLNQEAAMIYAVEEIDGKEVLTDAKSMSDGTLRFLGLLTAMLTVPPGTLLVIEEIDDSLHPSRVKNLIDALQKEAVERGVTVLFTTHNPALLDAVPPEIIAYVQVAYRDADTNFSKIDSLINLRNLAGLVSNGTLGWLATHEKLEKSFHAQDKQDKSEITGYEKSA